MMPDNTDVNYYLDEAEGILLQYTVARPDMEVDQVQIPYQGDLTVENPTHVPTLVVTLENVTVLFTQVVHTADEVYAVVQYDGQNTEIVFGQETHPLEILKAHAKELPYYFVQPLGSVH